MQSTRYTNINFESCCYFGLLDLRQKNLADDHVINAVIPFLIENPQITKLNLSDNGIRKALTELIQVPGLREIRLDNNYINDDILEEFVNANKNITTLYLKNNMIRSRGATSLAQCQIIIEIDLSDNEVDKVAIESFSQNATIKKLKLSNCHVDGAMAKTLASNQTIEFLDLSNNFIDDNGGLALAMNSTLTHLNLSNNMIGDLTFSAFAANKSIQELNLSNSKGLFKPIVSLWHIERLKANIKNYNLDTTGICILPDKTPPSLLKLSVFYAAKHLKIDQDKIPNDLVDREPLLQMAIKKS